MKKKAIACVIGAVFSGQLYAAQMPVAQAEIEPVVVMLLGRLEIFTVLILFTPAYWKK